MRHNWMITLAWVAAATFGGLSAASAGLVGHWTLDNDTTGLENLGSNGAASNLVAAGPLGPITGGPTFTPTGGAAGGYATFSGTQALIANAPGNAADALADYPFTFAAWIRASTSPVDRGAVVGLINTDAATEYFTMGTETLAEGLDFQGVRRNTGFIGTEAPNTSAIITDGQWHHIAAVYAAVDSFQLYLDGQLVAQDTRSVNFAPGFNAIGIGAQRRSAGFIDRYTGDVDDVRLYDTALSSAQIRSLVPEPASLALATIAACCVALVRLRQSSKD